MNRDAMLGSVRSRGAEPWDLVVIGGGATGLGAALDAASRGYAVALFEQSDFAKGTSSRSTKLVHGGVRYLRQGNVSLVMEALKERGLLLRNAPHLVRDVPFIVPSYEWWESPFYGIGLKVYDLLAGRYGFGRSSMLSKASVVEAIPSIRTEGLVGGTRYYDGQFDDARLAINLAATAAERGAVVLNYAPVVGLLKAHAGVIEGVRVRDLETGAELEVRARVVVNATGPFADGVRGMDKPGAPALIAPSRGSHVVLDRSFLPGESAIMVPHTDDGRVMFAIPWHSVAVVGTTDVPVERAELEPVPAADEIGFILETANRYLARPAGPEDVKSVFAGIRPLVGAGAENTAALSRDHTVVIEPDSGLITVAGGKWTTYRRMAQDIVDQAALLADLEPRECVTERLRIHGAPAESEVRKGSGDAAPDAQASAAADEAERAGAVAGERSFYGSDEAEIAALEREEPELAARIHPALSLRASEVVFACRREMARTVDDVLARRSRSLLLDARASRDAAENVAAVMTRELGRDQAWSREQAEEFRKLASGYVWEG